MAWSNNLQLYPTLRTFVWLWLAGLVLQLVVWACILWIRTFVKPTSKHAERSYSDLPSPHKQESSAVIRFWWRRFATQGKAMVLPQPARLSSGRPAFFVDLAAVQQHCISPLTWKRVALRSLVLAAAIALVQSIVGAIVLYMRTGSMLEQPYEWYSFANTGERLFKDIMPLRDDVPSSCAFNSSDSTDNQMKALGQLISNESSLQTLPHTIVYVLPCNHASVIELSLAQVLPSHDLGNEYERAAQIDGLTMFPYLWHSILGPQFDSHVSISVSPWTRTIQEVNLEYQLIRSQDQLATLPAESNLLVVAQSTTSLAWFMSSSELPKDVRVGFLSLTQEDCSNPYAKKLVDNKQVKFGFLPYGDCSLVDGKRIATLPLGPSFEHGFPLNVHKTRIPSVAERKHLLNLMVSWTIAKPTRVQAMMTALQVCRGRSCIVGHNDMLFKTLEFMDQHLGTNTRWSLSSAPSVYVETLKQSVFTLCPFGRNPEQYRIWEALAAGSIPIIEDLPAQSLPGSFYHPSYPQSWNCMPRDIHSVLKKLGAPVLFVTDWQRDLPGLLELYASDDEAGKARLSKLQAKTKDWYLHLGHHLQADVIEKSLRHFQPSRI